MKNDDMELVRGSGNVYRDFGYPDADVRQLKSILAAQILKILERDNLSVREAQRRTGIAAADFSRIRKVKLERFTIDRLLTIVNKLGMRLDFKITARRNAIWSPLRLKSIYDAQGARIAVATVAQAPGATCTPYSPTAKTSSGAALFTLQKRWLVERGRKSGDGANRVNYGGELGSLERLAGRQAVGDLRYSRPTLRADPLGTKRIQANMLGQVDETCTSLRPVGLARELCVY